LFLQSGVKATVWIAELVNQILVFTDACFGAAWKRQSGMKDPCAVEGRVEGPGNCRSPSFFEIFALRKVPCFP
jgi:hypothetical protein